MNNISYNQDLMMYVVCNLNNFPIYTFNQINNKFLYSGAYALSESTKNALSQKGFCFDDDGDNISHLNSVMGELSAIYWIWKNHRNCIQFLGATQHSRHWIEEFIPYDLQKNTIYIPEKCGPGEISLLDQYIQCHGYYEIESLYNLAHCGQIPLSIEDVEQLAKITFIYQHTNFICESWIFDKICEILFSCVFKMYEYQKQNSNVTNFRWIAERITTLIYLNVNKYIGNIKLVELPYLDLKLIKNN